MHHRGHEKLKAEGKSSKLSIARDAPSPSFHARTTPPADDDALLTSVQVRSRIGGVSTMCLWRWMRDPRVRFPAPIKIKRRNYWRIGDLRQWQNDRAAG